MTRPFRLVLVLVSLDFALSTVASAGPFLNAGISSGDSAIRAWADGVFDFSPSGDGSGFGDAVNALGVADGTFTSLGDLTAAEILAGDDPGRITLSFGKPITNGAGFDLAVFENAFSFFPPDDAYIFAELAFVEVSSNGVDFARFPSISLNTEATGDASTDILIPDFGSGPARDFAGILISNTDNLAGIHELNVGTLFDLDDLALDPLVIGGFVNLAAIGYVRVFDVPGESSFADSLGNPILDAWSTVGGFGTAGFDLDGVAALHVVPEPGTMALMLLGLAGLARAARRRVEG